MNEYMEVRIPQIQRRGPVVHLNGRSNRGGRLHLEPDPLKEPVERGQVQHWTPTSRGLGNHKNAAIEPRGHRRQQLLDCPFVQ